MNKLPAIEKTGSSVLQLEQAIYGSRQSTLNRGYHVMAKSPGVSSETVTQLNRWCPSHGSLLDGAQNAWSLNFHPIDCDRFALSRTVYGEREFSNRGGLQVVTMILILNQQHLAQYENNPFAIARVARSWGLLRWSRFFPKELRPIQLPCAAASETAKMASPKWLNASSTAMKAVDASNAVALTSRGTCIDMVESLFLQMPSNRRLRLSFTTGLKPSGRRPFRLHLVDEKNLRLLRTSFPHFSVVRLESDF